MQGKATMPSISLTDVRPLSSVAGARGFGLSPTGGPFHGLLDREPVLGVQLNHIPIVTSSASLAPLDVAEPGTNLPVFLLRFKSTFTITSTGLSVPKVRPCQWCRPRDVLPSLSFHVGASLAEPRVVRGVVRAPWGLPCPPTPASRC